jgi:hypothetical protein
VCIIVWSDKCVIFWAYGLAQAVVGKGREKQKAVCVIPYNQHMGYAAKVEVYL